jgi:hypothetical protein
MEDPPLLCILVLAPPRSGSSMVGGILHHLGIDMGPAKPPDRGNPLGYFEDVRFLNLHRAWSRRHEPDPERRRLKLPPRSYTLTDLDLSRHHRLVKARCRCETWGLKDPELCYYVNPLLHHYAGPLRVIATRRDPAAMARSLAIVRGFSAADCIRVVDDYAHRQAQAILELEERLDRNGVLAVDYAEAIADAAGAVRAIASYVGLPVTANALTFVRPELDRCGNPIRSVASQGDSTRTM